MRIRRIRLGGFLAALALAALAVPGLAAAAEGKFDRTLTVSGPADLDVSTGAGGITVRAGGAGTVRVTGVIRANGAGAEGKVRQLESNPPIQQDGSTIRIGHPSDPDLLRNVSITYEIVAPPETRLRARTGSGGQTVDGIRGPVDVQTGSGGLTVSNIVEEVRAQTGSGGIELNSIRGAVHAMTGSGGIRGASLAGPLVAATGSGSVRLEQAGGNVEVKTAAGAPIAAFRFSQSRAASSGGVEVRTGSGSVEVGGVKGALRVRSGSGNITAQGDPSGEWNLEVGSGNVTLKLPAQAAFDFHGRTGSGHIRMDHPMTVQGTLGRHEVEGKVRGGGPLVYVKTASGNIEVQ